VVHSAPLDDPPIEPYLPRLVVHRRHAVLDSVLNHILPKVDDRIATIDDLVDKTFHASSVVQAGEKGEDDLVIAHVRLA
jgi:hypothetical protein